MTPEIGPHGYLVLRRHNLDDLPMRFFWDCDDAIEYCDNLSPEDTEGILDIFRMDVTAAISIIVLQFANGKPIKIIHDRVLD